MIRRRKIKILERQPQQPGKLQQTKQQIEAINSLTIDQAGLNTTKNYRRNHKLKYEERHRRVTIYIENKLHHEIESLRERGLILNKSAMINTALKEYIQKHHTITPS